MPQVDTHRRLFPAARRLAKLALVRWDLWKHRAEPAVQTWKPVLAGAYSGHIVVPSRAISSSREEAADFAAHGLVAEGDRVLDVGAGNGRQAIGLIEMGVAEYVGLDIIPGSVEWGTGRSPVSRVSASRSSTSRTRCTTPTARSRPRTWCSRSRTPV